MAAISPSSSIFTSKQDDASALDCKDLSLLEIIATPNYYSLLKKLEREPKVELHAHLGGAVPMEFAKKNIAADKYFQLAEFIKNIQSGIDYSRAFDVFSQIGAALQTNDSIEEAVFDFCEQQYEEKVVFTELRTGLKRLSGEGFEKNLQAVIRGLEKGMRQYPIQVTLLLSLRRNTSFEDAEETLDLAIKYQGEIVRGIDISGESIKGDGSGIFNALKRAREHNLPITLHLGESPKETAEQQMKELREIEPTRIGHAVHLCPEAWGWIKERKLVIEACIRSALSVQMIKRPSEHPALRLFKNGHPVVFCTDDSTLFGNLSEELALVACLCGLSLEKVIEMQIKARDLAF